MESDITTENATRTLHRQVHFHATLSEIKGPIKMDRIAFTIFVFLYKNIASQILYFYQAHWCLFYI